MTTFLDSVQCSPWVHKFYASFDTAEAVARAKSCHGQYYVVRKCPACSGWRLQRVG